MGKGDAGVKKRSGCCKAIARICALRRRGRQGNRVYSLSHPASASCGRNDSVSRSRDCTAPLPTHLLRICAGALKWREQCAISKFAGGKEPTSSRQGILVCGALRLPHDLICLPLLFPQNSLRDFCRSPERQESAFSPPRRRQNMEFYKVRKRFLAPSRRRREKTFVRYARRRVDRFHAPECLRAFPPSRR